MFHNHQVATQISICKVALYLLVPCPLPLAVLGKFRSLRFWGCLGGLVAYFGSVRIGRRATSEYCRGLSMYIFAVVLYLRGLAITQGILKLNISILFDPVVDEPRLGGDLINLVGFNIK